MSVLDQNIAIFKYFEEISKIPHPVEFEKYYNL